MDGRGSGGKLPEPFCFSGSATDIVFGCQAQPAGMGIGLLEPSEGNVMSPVVVISHRPSRADGGIAC